MSEANAEPAVSHPSLKTAPAGAEQKSSGSILLPENSTGEQDAPATLFNPCGVVPFVAFIPPVPALRLRLRSSTDGYYYCAPPALRSIEASPNFQAIALK